MISSNEKISGKTKQKRYHHKLWFICVEMRSGCVVMVHISYPSSCVSLQIKKNSTDKAKKVEKMSKEFAAMEEAAMKAYEEDMKRLKAEAGNVTLQFCPISENVFHIPLLLFLLSYLLYYTSLN